MNSLRMPILISILLSASFAGAQIRTKSVKEKQTTTASEESDSTSEGRPRSKVRYVYVDETLADERAARPYNLSAGMIQYVYDEPGVMKISGNMVEVGGQARYNWKDTNSFMAGDLRWANGGNLHYDGGTQNLKTGEKTASTANSKDSILNIQGLYGFSYRATSSSDLEFFGGLGRWQLNNKISGQGSYAREAIYYYLPVGVNYAHKMSSAFMLIGGLDMNIYLSGSTTSKMSDISPGNPDIVHQQSSGSGYKFRVGGEYAISPTTKFIGGVYYQIWDIEASNLVAINVGDDKRAYLVEPKNKTTMLGFNAGVTF